MGSSRSPVPVARLLPSALALGLLLTPILSAQEITRDVGSIAVIEHDGSNYDKKDGSGELNVAPRENVAQRFYATHGDNYDALVVFTNFEFDTGTNTAFHLAVRSDVPGIGLPLFDNGSRFGSPGRLASYVDMAAVGRYRQGLYRLTPGTPGFTETLNVVAHELAHRWLTYVRYFDGNGQPSSDLLGLEASHWSYLLDSDGSVMYGSDWADNADGTFTATRVRSGYSALDLYLMGLLEPTKVGAFTLLRNVSSDPTALPKEGDVVDATAETISVDQVIAAEGARSPAFAVSPKAFRVAFIFLTAPGTEPAAEDLDAVDRVRRTFAAHFFALTRGIAVADTTLAEAPLGPSAPRPDLDRARAWLVARQALDGRFEDSRLTGIRDTTAAVLALEAAGGAESAVVRALEWLEAVSPASTDFIARRDTALAGRLDSGQREAARLALLDRQNADGGFGPGTGFQSGALDTALALRALRGLGQAGDAAVLRAIAALVTLQSPSGGWPLVQGGEASSVATAHVALALQDWRQLGAASGPLAAAVAALQARQNPDGGFGESPSTPYATALALEALVLGGAPEAVTEPAIAWLQSVQLVDGSWEGSRYQTALVLAALKGGVNPNLIVPADPLVFVPPRATEGDVVQVTARVVNIGATPAGDSVARLYEGDPGNGVVVAEASVSGLDPSAWLDVTLELPTLGRPGSRTFYLVADALGQVVEGREDDNATARALTIDGLLPDLVIRPGDFAAAPVPPEEGETVNLTVVVSNAGARPAAASVLSIVDGDPAAGGTLIGQAAVPALGPGAMASVAFDWPAAGLGDHTLFAVADAVFGVFESDEGNNRYALSVSVTPPLPPGPDLEVLSLHATPATLTTLPQAVTLTAVVRNLGKDPAAATLSVRDTTAGIALTELPLNLAPRSSTTLNVPVTLDFGGDREIEAVADAAGALGETNESNNRASVQLLDPRNTVDPEVLDVQASPADVVIGQVVTVAATVRNRGTSPVSGIPVALVRVHGWGDAELLRQDVSLEPGASTPLVFEWTSSETGEPLPLALVADIFDLLPELSETNNRVAFGVQVRHSPLPDLAVSGGDVTFVPDPPLEGQTASVGVRVRNPGAVPAGSFVTRFFVGDPDDGGRLIGETTTAGLDPGAESNVGVAWSPVDVRGEQGIFVRVDPAGAVEEYDEANNAAFRPFDVLGLPDLVLTTGELRLTPTFPRRGEPVNVRATVRNLGSQTAPESTLRGYEGEPASGTPIGDVLVPALAPGASFEAELSWTPSGSIGLTTLSLIADADGAATEQDEGNNTARKDVIVQNADFYLTNVFFSPNGDGGQDSTTLGYRASGDVNVVISNRRGRVVRTLATTAPPEGFLDWDGHDDAGRLLPDGAYTLTVASTDGIVLGRAAATIDTNRSAIHDAVGTGLLAVRNLTCDLPNVEGPAWMPAEDEQLFIVGTAAPGFPVGLVRVAADGALNYVSEDPWFGGTTTKFPSEGSVSMDGREVLVVRGAALVAVDLASGARRQLGNSAYARWSPDARRIVTDQEVLARDGSVEATLPRIAPWVWSPDGEYLAWGDAVVRRDGSELRQIPLPPSIDLQTDSATRTEWRRDGKIASSFRRQEEVPDPGGCDGDPDCTTFVFVLTETVLLDPANNTAEIVPGLHGIAIDSFSPDATRVLHGSQVANDDGSAPLPLLDRPVIASPGRLAAHYRSSEAARPGGACAGRGGEDVFGVFNLQNLVVDLDVRRLPVNTGLELRGSAVDRNFDRFELDYAVTTEPDTWHPIGSASSVPVVDDVLAVFVPAAPGTYVVRLKTYDRAGNNREALRLIAWDLRPAIANVTQTETLISPDGNGIKDEVRVDYLIQEPTRAEIRIRGPKSGDSTGPLVRSFSFDYPDLGPAFFVWDGRDEQGQVVPDGRYEISLNGLPLRVDVDVTPPDIAFVYSNLRAETRHLIADLAWHVVDPHLREWSRGWLAIPGTEQVFEIVLENAVPTVKFEAGRPADVHDQEEDDVLTDFVETADPFFRASDHAGNDSTLHVPPLAERLILVGAVAANGENVIDVPFPPQRVHLLPEGTVFLLSETLRSTPSAGENAWFEYQPTAGGPWTALPSFKARDNFLWREDLAGLGVPRDQILRGRFVLERAGERYPTGEFLFRLCEDFLSLSTSGAGSGFLLLEVKGETQAPLVSATVFVEDLNGLRSAPLEVTNGPGAKRSLRGLIAAAGCTPTEPGPTIWVVATGEGGRSYTDNGRCLVLRQQENCAVLEDSIGERGQVFEACPLGAPDRGFVELEGITLVRRELALVRDPEGTPLAPSAEVGPGPFTHRFTADLSGAPHGSLSAKLGFEPPAELFRIIVDRQPLSVSVTSAEQQCLANDSAGEHLDVTVDVQDDGPAQFLSLAEYQAVGGPWTALSQDRFTGDFACESGACQATGKLAPAGRQPPPFYAEAFALTGRSSYRWDVSGLPEGSYTLRLHHCDRAGNTAVTDHPVQVTRKAPYVALSDLQFGQVFLFSPNGDGRRDTVEVRVQSFQQSKLTVKVQQGHSVIRTLADSVTYPAGTHPFVWDGRDGAGLVAADGKYDLVFQSADDCGRAGDLTVPVELDATPPAAAITRPPAAETVGASIDVLGSVSDVHLEGYALSFGEGASPDSWTEIEAGGADEVSGLLGYWDAPDVPGTYTLRLVATDRAENQTEVRTTVSVTPGDYIVRLAAAPQPFSPNGDGRRETTTIDYRLKADARVTLELLVGATPVRRLIDATVMTAGDHNLAWDGKDDAGEPVPDGNVTLRMHAAEPVTGAGADEESLTLTIDRVAPAIALAVPEAGACVDRSGSGARGTIDDLRVTGYAIEAETDDGSIVPLADGIRQPEDLELARFAALAEGGHLLRITAEDGAENRALHERPFVVDSIDPVVRLNEPLAGVVRKADDPVAVVGTVVDSNLTTRVLSFGAGAAPATFVEIARATTGGEAINVGSWSVATLPDGVYTLKLVATDCAGHSSEARVTVTLDGTPPIAEIHTPSESGYAKTASPIDGAATDANLEGWTLEVAPGAAFDAFQWSEIASKEAAVVDALLAPLPLLPDGVHTLRLMVVDRAGLEASALRSFTVDNVPPAPPTGLAVEITKTGDTYGDFAFTWNPNGEPDLAGYRVFRAGQQVSDGVTTANGHTDFQLGEGVYRYEITALDLAGNESARSSIEAHADFTPPIADILAPRPGGAVSGAVSVRGTAYSPDDFKVYRLYVGAGAEPAAWTLLRQATIPVTAGILGPWTAVGDGPYVLALEAEDLSGNVARATAAVTIDNAPPEPPVLASVAAGTDVTSLVATWDPSPSTDVDGYLVLRNGRIANAPGIVIGDRRAYLVPAPSYLDGSLPDGRHCYRVEAMDHAGNLSPPSNELCASLDNRSPAAILLEPPAGLRFDQPIYLLAHTDDTDIATLQLQYKAAADAAWTGLGAPDTAAPYEGTLDPDGLAFGDYDLRAVATDLGGRTDPAPASIRVTYGDATAPARPLDLRAAVDGGTIVLTWTPAADPDLSFYRVLREGNVLGEPAAPTLTETGLRAATYEYEVRAVDGDGNESAPSFTTAVVYPITLHVPFPVTLAASTTLSGTGARSEASTVRIYRDAEQVAETTTANPDFTAADVPLLAGSNRLWTVAEDAEGNRSLPSNSILMISNAAPAPVSGLAANVDGRDVQLSWDASAESDALGYLVARDGEALLGSVPQTETAALTATSSRPGFEPSLAFDGDPTTAWAPSLIAPPPAWTVELPATVLVDRVALAFSAPEGIFTGAADYRIEVLYEGQFETLFSVRGNTLVGVEHAFPFAFATDAVRVVLDSAASGHGLAEVTLSRREVVALSAPSFVDGGAADGPHSYGVTVIDRYGAVSAESGVNAALPDDVPSAPTGLVASVAVRDVVLTWNANPEPDIDHYEVRRDGALVGSSPTSTFRDPSLADGPYVYTVRAVDSAGHVSPDSAPASATIAPALERPAAPVTNAPTDSVHPLPAAEAVADVRGQAGEGSFVALEVNGLPAGVVQAGPGPAFFGETLSTAVAETASAAAVANDGLRIAYAFTEGGVQRVRLVSTESGAAQDLAQASGEQLRLPADSRAFSSDGGRLLVVARQSDGGEGLEAVDVATLARASLVTGLAFREAEWSPDGTRVAFVDEIAGESRLRIVDVATGQVTPLTSALRPARLGHPRFSPLGAGLAYGYWPAASASSIGLRVREVGSGAEQLVSAEAWPGAPADWSSDGSRLAFTLAASGAALRVVAWDAGAGTLQDLTDGSTAAFAPRFGEGDELLFAEPAADGMGRRFVASAADGGGRVAIGPFRDAGPALHARLADGRVALGLEGRVGRFEPRAGSFEIPGVALEPGENVLLARAIDLDTALQSPPSESVRLIVGTTGFADLVAAEIGAAPALPNAGQSVVLSVRASNEGDAASPASEARFFVTNASGETLLDQTLSVAPLQPGESLPLALLWTAPAPGTYTIAATLDPADAVTETGEANNTATDGVVVTAAAGAVLASLATDRPSYPAAAEAFAIVSVTNAGPEIADGVARLTLETANGGLVTQLDERALSLAYGDSLEYVVSWNAGAIHAGGYVAKLYLLDASGEVRGEAEAPLTIEPHLTIEAHLVADRAEVTAGSAASFAASALNTGLNAPLQGGTARLRIVDEADQTVAFTGDQALPTLLPSGGSWQASVSWPQATPAGSYRAELEVLASDGAVLDAATAAFRVVAPATEVSGALDLDPAAVLTGDPTEARIAVTNPGAQAMTGVELAVEVTAGASATVLARATTTLDLPAGATVETRLPLSSGGIAPGAYPVFLRAAGSSVSLDRSTLVVHGPIGPPSLHAPPDGALVSTSRPTLEVNNATAAAGAALTYEFELYADAALTQPMPGIAGVTEGSGRTSWRVSSTLAEDRTYFWRARAGDAFSSSAWTAVASFTVDQENLPPGSPTPDSPAAGATVATRQPTLIVNNAIDPELDPLSYELRLASDPEMTAVIASASGIPETPERTGWPVNAVLADDTTYHWNARASDGPSLSPWSAVASFHVAAQNAAPTTPTPLQPVDVSVATTTPELAVSKATDPDGDTLAYLFQIDRAVSFDSPALQVSPELNEGASETAWTAPLPLDDDTTYFWRASASDGSARGPWAEARFFVNLANDPPSVPVPLDPADGQVVTTPGPTLRVRNAVDADGDVLVYDFRVNDTDGVEVAYADGIAETPLETSWPIDVTLAENGVYFWSARARDAESASAWSAPSMFRVNALYEPPTAPSLVAPAEGAIVAERRPALVVANATSPEGDPLSYSFELYGVATDGSLTLVESVSGLAEGTDTTSWTASADLADGSYSWRAAAHDGVQSGPWMPSARFSVAVDVPPAPPTGLAAAPGDARVHLTWNANTEPDVAGYRVYRGASAGGPYASIGDTAATSLEDTGLANGITVYYVVTARDAAFESGYSAEVAATPQAVSELLAEIRFEPSRIGGECLVDHGPDHDAHGCGCPGAVHVTIELPAGLDPRSIDRSSVRIEGGVAPRFDDWSIVDDDHDGNEELRQRFELQDLAPALGPGVNALSVTGVVAGGQPFRGVGTLEVEALELEMRVTPKTLVRHANGADVRAHISLEDGLRGSDVDTASLLLNGVVPVKRVVNVAPGRVLVDFDRAAVLMVLPNGNKVPVSVTGIVRGLAFIAHDTVKVRN